MSLNSAWRERVMRERAERLAERPAPAADAATVRALTCNAGGVVCALPLEALARVAPFTRPARLADASDACLGLMNRGGDFVLVYDLARLLGLPAGSAEDGAVVLLRATGVQLGLRVEAAGAVETLTLLAEDDVSGMRPFELGSGYARAADGRTVTLLDPNILLERLRSERV